ncbi:hypothetical protein H5185_12385 [Shewanella sp. SG44-6]|jgi:hypothetical protein|uniref:hypothetical protein n=1 Tax=Shewanella sp. SG44-6 TaxID=2760959 RepID=UPI001603E29D|nr:hypothetical protein [Shewanella sp. SG44-6]MBB1390212.1 hypothetical protein [Shewanella sp. SG44-6]
MKLTIRSIYTTVHKDSDYEDAITICFYKQITEFVKFTIGEFSGEFERSSSTTRLASHMIECGTPAVLDFQDEEASPFKYNSIFPGLNKILECDLSSLLENIYEGKDIEVADSIGFSLISELKHQYLSYLDLAELSEIELSLYAIIAQGKVGFDCEELANLHYSKFICLKERFEQFARNKIEFSGFIPEGLRALMKPISDDIKKMLNEANFVVPFFASRFEY